MYKKMKEILAAASGFVLAAPVKLPAKLVIVAKYVALAVGLLEAVEQSKVETHQVDDDEGQPAD